MITNQERAEVMARTARVLDRTDHVQFPDAASSASTVAVCVRLGDLQLLRRLAIMAQEEIVFDEGKAVALPVVRES